MDNYKNLNGNQQVCLNNLKYLFNNY